MSRTIRRKFQYTDAMRRRIHDAMKDAARKARREVRRDRTSDIRMSLDRDDS